MLTDQEQSALRTWYAQPHILKEAEQFYKDGALERMEDYLHKVCILPLGRHDQLPDFMKNDQGEPLFPDNLDPRENEEKWQDAIEIGWAVMKEKLGVSHDDIHKNIANIQQKDWDAFMKSVEERKKERGRS